MDHDTMAKVFPEMTALRDVGKCPGCGGPITGFRDSLSKREFEITGMCQKCQDEMDALGDEPPDDDYEF